MFGTNEIAGRKHFADAPADTLAVTSVFFTLQGEGPLTGQPSVFVRLAKCNLACTFCDTYFDTGEQYTFDQLALLMQRRILAYFRGDLPPWAQWRARSPRRINVVITGGEPLLQTNVFGFVRYLNTRSVNGEQEDPEYTTVQFESNGTLSWTDDATDLGMGNTVLVVSPKVSQRRDGTMLNYLRPHPSVLRRANALKFVVHAPDSWGRPEITHAAGAHPYSLIPYWAHEWSEETGRPVYLSPMNMYLQEPQAALLAQKTNTTVDINTRSEELERISFWEPGLLDMAANQRNHEYAAHLCMLYGFRLSLQTHLLASLP